jgi:predicted aldo/keto reductase-like oxidoreductase
MSKEVSYMTTEKINSERNELEPMVLLMKETGIVEHDGINYFDIAKRYHELCKESVVRELLKQNKDDE